ncbi:LacI family DNA-binding transcriptional regulator [Propionibacteriaceae bacterium G1746]
MPHDHDSFTPHTRRATSSDVARRAGTSRATVSYVMNNTPGITISEATRERVLKAARDLKYVPHLAARSLAAGRSNIVLLVLPDAPMTLYMLRFIQSLHRSMRQRSMILHAYFAGADDVDAAEGVGTMAYTVLALRTLPVHQQEAFRSRGLRVFAPNATVEQDRLTIVDEVHAECGSAATRFLVDRGHERLGYAAYDDPRRDPFSHPRRTAVLKTAESLGLPEPVMVRVGADNPDPEVIVTLAEAGVTGIITYNDDVALILLRLVREAELDETFEVIGGSNLPYTQLMYPNLSSVDRDTDGLADAIVSQIRGEPVAIDVASLVRVIDRS